MTVYFPEPTIPDVKWAEGDEKPHEWLARSTQPRACAIRDFLNRSLSAFPEDVASSLAKKLAANWSAHWFEIVVGRYLQVLGATIEHEPVGSNGTKVDFRATFPDGIVSVECVAKEYNRASRAEISRNARLSAMLDEIAPAAWIIGIDRLPPVTPAEFEPLRDAAAAWFASLPAPEEGGIQPDFAAEVDGEVIELTAIPYPKGNSGMHIGPAVSYRPDAIERVRAALRNGRKRAQARGADPPVFLAIDCPFGGPDAEDFDRALFGDTVMHLALDHRTVAGYSFNPTGILVTDREIPFAGVWAFLGMRMTSAADPVLYLNPYQRSELPSAIAAHEQRVWASSIEVKPASRLPLIESLGFVDYERWDS